MKVPLVYTSVALRNWQAFRRLGIFVVRVPGGYRSYFHLNRAVDIGCYTAERSADRPIPVHMVRTPRRPDLPPAQQPNLIRRAR